MRKRLLVDAAACTECRTCELTCSMTHLGVFNRNKSGIRIQSHWPGLPTWQLCRQCEEPACLAACPVEALVRTGDGNVRVLHQECTGCGACVDACPYDGVWLDPLSNVAIKCDTCQGAFACVSNCFAGALSAGEAKDA